MSSITIKDKSFVPFIEEKKLQEAVKKIAEEINKDYKEKEPLFLGVLNGSFMFLADLLKSIDISCTISFVKIASYDGLRSKGNANELIGLNESVEGRDIILVEDIIDTGNTLEELHIILAHKKAKSIKIATLLYKPEAYIKSHTIDYIGIEIPNDFVVGYGLDYDGFGRNSRSLYVLDN